MEDLQIHNKMKIKSKINGEYTVDFIQNLKLSLEKEISRNNCVIIIDEKVLSFFKKEITVDINNKIVAIQCSEKNKTIDYAQEVIRKLVKLKFRKDSDIIAIGGGITQDIVAFISSILYRGVNWKFYPTSLLAQCDSCIGSKSSINFDKYKNLLGTFNPPSEIFIYNSFLNTLSDSEIKSGIGEMLHYFFTDGIDIALKLSNQYDKLISNRENLLFFIKSSLKIKKKIIEIDEFDLSIRHIFNYGHTFGHAIEAISNYSVPHGQAITIGMDLANYISLNLKMLSLENFNIMHNILIKNKPSYSINSDNIELYCSALSKDKKNKGNKLGCILSNGPGNVQKVFLNIDKNLKDLIINYFKVY